MRRYHVEFVLSAESGATDSLRHALGQCAEGAEIIALPQSGSPRGHEFKIQVTTIDPTIVFDMCAPYGRIKSVKINEGTP